MAGIVDEALGKGKEDVLDISNHTKALTKFIRETDTPITIGIQGEWGSGKTSLLNQIHYGLTNLEEAEIKENGSFKQIWVNSWEHSLLCTPEECLIKIINQIINELIGSDVDKKRGEQITAGVKNVLQGALRIGGAVALGSAGKDLADGIIGESTNSIAELKHELDELVVDICSRETNPFQKIVVYVDDLDRIPPPDAVSILELLKNIFNIKKCVFVLAIDYGVVVKGLVDKFGKPTPENEWEFRAFFDKIIQLPFMMPMGEYDIGKYVKDLLEEIEYYSAEEGADELEDELLKELVLDSIGGNPRSIKRLVNSLALIKIFNDLSREDDIESVLGDKNQATIMFALVCLQISFPEIYELLVRYPDFTSWNEDIAEQLTQKKEERAENWATNSAMAFSSEDFNEGWEQCVYRICYLNPKYRPKANSISRFLTTLMEDVKDSKGAVIEKEVLQELITVGLGETAVTNVQSTETSNLRPKKGERKRHSEGNIDGWVEYKLEKDEIKVDEVSLGIIKKIIEIWKNDFNAVNDLDEKKSNYRITYATNVTLNYFFGESKRKIAEIAIEKRTGKVKFSVLRTPKNKFKLITVNGLDFNLSSKKITINEETKTASGKASGIEFMRAEIRRRDSEKLTPEAVNYVTKAGADFWDNKFAGQITTKQVNGWIKAFQTRRRKSGPYEDAKKRLKEFYSEDFRETVNI